MRTRQSISLPERPKARPDQAHALATTPSSVRCNHARRHTPVKRCSVRHGCRQPAARHRHKQATQPASTGLAHHRRLRYPRRRLRTRLSCTDLGAVPVQQHRTNRVTRGDRFNIPRPHDNTSRFGQYLLDPRSCPTTLRLSPPDVPTFAPTTTDASTPSYVNPPDKDPTLTPAVTDTTRLPDDPAPTTHTTDVSDPHTVA